MKISSMQSVTAAYFNVDRFTQPERLRRPEVKPLVDNSAVCVTISQAAKDLYEAHQTLELQKTLSQPSINETFIMEEK